MSVQVVIRIFLFIVFFLNINHSYSQDGYVNGNPDLAFWQVGDKEEIIIILHGGPAVQHEYLRPEFDELAKVGRVIYYDQRGCGKSERADSYAWQEHVNDLNKIINCFSKGEKVVLAGSSWGSILAILYAYTHPE
ncbi:MAG: alpha/beta fold hydrolase, partial [Cyclobacteriaceae bacterium]